MNVTQRLRSGRAFALVLALWVISILSFAVFTASLLTRENLYAVGDELNEFYAHQRASSALALGSHPLIEPGDPILKGELGFEEWDTMITTEEARLNLNALLQGNGEATLRKLFELWGMPERDRRYLVDALIDAVDEGGFEEPNGAEEQYYRSQGINDMPRNEPFRTLDEVLLVRGMDQLAAGKPDWKNYFTLRGTGALDASSTTPELLAAASLSSLAQAEKVVSVRNGYDGIARTQDDQPAPLEILGRRPDGFPVTLQGATLRIETWARSGSAEARLAAIGRKSSDGLVLQHYERLPAQIQTSSP